MRHPDEGEIHAWLDGALDPATAAWIEAHVAACPACASAVAEARGLIAGASRILMALDGVPGGVLPVGSQPAGGMARDDLAVARSEQQRDTNGTARRPVPWYARRVVQVAAGLMLVAGIGSLAVSDMGRSSDQLMVDFETVPTGSGPSVGGVAAPAAADAGASAATVGGAPIGLPAPTPDPKQETRAANRVAEAPQASAKSIVGDAAPARGAVREERARAALDKAAPVSVAGAPVSVAAGLPIVSLPSAPTPTAPPPLAPPAVAPAQGFSVGAAGAVSSLARQNALADSTLRRSAESLAQTRLDAMTADATRGLITGKVIAADGAALESASVLVRERNTGTLTAADGSFTLPPLPPGTYTIEARRIGYTASTDTVRVAAGGTAMVNLALTQASLKLSEVVVTGAGPSAFAGACFALDVNAADNAAGIPLLPRRVRIRLSESGDADLATADAAYGLRLRRTESSPPAGAPSEPARPLAWSEIDTDSVEVTWPLESDVVTLVLEVRRSIVRGTARSSLANPAWTATVRGSKVTCTR